MKYLEKYPFDERARACHQYINAIKWEDVHDEVRRTESCVFCISDVVKLFPNLSLMPGYELYAYIFPEYHGLWGRIAGIKAGEATAPQTPPAGFGRCRSDYALPENAVHPLSVLYADGSAEGYLDAFFAEKLFDELPRAEHQIYREGKCRCEQPEDYHDCWKVNVDIPDWRPRAEESDAETTIWLIWSEWHKPGLNPPYEDIYLKQYRFWKVPWMEHLLLRDSQNSIYRKRIEERRPYESGRHCCLHYTEEILIAKSKTE